MAVKSNFSDAVVSMLGQHHLVYGEGIVLDDNFYLADKGGRVDFIYGGSSVKLAFILTLFCKKGTMRIGLNFEDYFLNENDLLIILSGNIFNGAWIPADCRYGIICLSDNNVLDIMYSNLTLMLQKEIIKMPRLIHFSPAAMDIMVHIYQLSREAVMDKGLAYKEKVLGGYQHVMVAYLINEIEKNKKGEVAPKVSRSVELFRKFLVLVQEHYTEHRDITFYADEMCITPGYLYTVVKKASGRTPVDLIRDYVIMDAKAMILSREYTMQQISNKLHFANSSFFGKYFKEAVGCPPKRYMAEYEKSQKR